MIQLGSGHILTREPKPQMLKQLSVTVPYHAQKHKKLDKCSHFTISSKAKNFSLKSDGRHCIAPVTWLLDCISHYRFIDVWN